MAFAGATLVGLGVGRWNNRTGESVPAPSPVHSPVTKTASAIEVPDVLSVKEKQAREVIRAKHLKIDVTTGTHLTIPAGHVISQYPSPGNGVPRDGTVRIRISTGLPPGARPSGNTTIVVAPPISSASSGRSLRSETYAASPDAPEYNYRLTDTDLAGKSESELDIMRNTIFARHGRRFGRRDLQDYFERQSWYRGDPNYSDARLSKMEERNAAFILQYQKNGGSVASRDSHPSYSPPRPSYSNAPSYNYPLSISDLAGKSDWELDIMRNTIYAKYGNTFRRRDLQNYFDSQPWYRRNSNFRESWLSPTEKRNAALIASYQKRR
jgi:hypothetical protein